MKMKSIFKKAISVLCAAAVVATCFSTSMFAFAENQNIALQSNLAQADDATVTVDSTHNDASNGRKVRAVNGKIADYWQTSNKTGNQNFPRYNDPNGNYTDKDAWIQVTWASAKTTDSVKIYWRESGKMGKKWWQSQKVSDKDNADAFAGIKWKKPVSFKHLTIYWRDAGKWTTADYVIQISTDGSRTWETVEATKTREDLGTQTYDGVECDRVFKDTVVLAEEAECNAVRIYLADGDKTVQMYELEIYGDAGDNANTGVESNGMWILLFAAAACVFAATSCKVSRAK